MFHVSGTAGPIAFKVGVCLTAQRPSRYAFFTGHGWGSICMCAPLFNISGTDRPSDATFQNLRVANKRIANPSAHRRRNGGGTGTPSPLECEILTLTLWALHGKNEAKSRWCHPPWSGPFRRQCISYTFYAVHGGVTSADISRERLDVVENDVMLKVVWQDTPFSRPLVHRR